MLGRLTASPSSFSSAISTLHKQVRGEVNSIETILSAARMTGSSDLVAPDSMASKNASGSSTISEPEQRS